MAKRQGTPFPTRDEVVRFIRESPTPVGKREIARAFHLSGEDRIALKRLLKEIKVAGLVERSHGKRLAAAGRLPPVTVVVVTDIDTDGEVVARPLSWSSDQPPPRIYMAPDKRGHPALIQGDRVLARLTQVSDNAYEGRSIRKLERPSSDRMVGTFYRHADGGMIEPAQRRQRDSVYVSLNNSAGAEDGEIVVAEMSQSAYGGRPSNVTVVERLGRQDDPGLFSLIAAHAAGLPTEFPAAAVDQAEASKPPELGNREDLRDLPLVTIDGPDARDFDDAVWAERAQIPGDDEGWRLIVAIADVSEYVPTDSPLDREALNRGNSCYFPDRVLPMLPEALSSGLCSLRPGEDRACFAVEIVIDGRGRPHRHRFFRGLMRSSARLTYEQVQAARDGRLDAEDEPVVLQSVIDPLYGAFGALMEARNKRGTLDLEIPERQISVNADGKVEAITRRERLDSHRLIEEFMIAANVAAATTLQDHREPCLYRVHDAPDRAKIDALGDVLEPLGYRIARGQALKPRMFTQVLAQVHGRPEAALVSQLILRSQSQASYSPENIGHFGLALARYAHFTSPIRRYADLVVHRALIRLLRLGADGMTDGQMVRLEEVGRQVSETERRAASAERDAADRYVAAFLAAHIGQDFSGTVSGVTRFGLFVILRDSGADGLIPVGTLPDDYYEHDERSHTLVGRRWGRVFRLGAPVVVRLRVADPLSGSTILELIDGEEGADLPGLPQPTEARSRPPQGRRGPAGRKGPPGRKGSTRGRSR